MTVWIGLALLILPCTSALAQQWSDYLDLGVTLAAIEPSPIGDGHLGEVPAGTFVQLRFPVPDQDLLAYRLNLGNIVGYSGRGSSYQLILRRDSQDGPIIHEGPIISNGDDWNASNRVPIDLTTIITPQDRARGWIDVFATALVQGDTWTVYRHNPTGRQLTATAVIATPETMAMIRSVEAMSARGICVIPMPQVMQLDEGEVSLRDGWRISVLGEVTEADRFGAEDLADQVKERAQINLKLAPGGEIVLELVSPGRLQTQARRLGLELSQVVAGAYLLEVGDTVHAWAAEGDGLFYAAQTIAQLVSPRGTLPRCRIADWPAYAIRGLQYDVARGQTVEVEWWQRLIRALGRCKLNMLVVYGENDYRFERYPFLGREGTFTPEKAKLLSEYAHRYHMQLVPQFESLGHASAVLRAEELKSLREAGGSWVFCTSEPQVWEFLDNVFGELAQQFPYARYLHVGGDEFEMGFGKCERCRVRPVGELYAEHMNRLNALCRKHGRKMLFWPSHAGPTPELSFMTIRYHQLLEKDCIPTEWIYHGPATYPEIQQYQDLGFEDCWVSPAVVCYSRLWPDYRTTWRGISGFHQAGHERGVRGSMTTTWEWQEGALVANSLPGMFYAAECAWSLGRTPVADFERRYAGWWLGDIRPEAGPDLDAALIEPWPRSGPAAICHNARLFSDLLLTPPRTVRLDHALKNPALADAAEAIIAANQQALQRLDALCARAAHNADLLDYPEAAYRAYIYCARKLQVTGTATEHYRQARRALPHDRAQAADLVAQAAAELRGLAAEADAVLALYDRARQQLGAAASDVRAVTAQRDDLQALGAELEALVAQVRAGQIDRLPPAEQFGFYSGNYTKVGSWAPEQMSEQGAELRVDISAHVRAAGELSVEWQYTRGAHGVRIARTELWVNGQKVAEDVHQGWAGSGSHNNIYTLTLERFVPGARYELVGWLQSSGGTDSRGDIWLNAEAAQ